MDTDAFMVNAGDIAESLASPSWHSQRLRPTLCNQWVDPQLRHVHAQRNELAFICLIVTGQSRDTRREETVYSTTHTH